MNPSDPHNLQRFVSAQDRDYLAALDELRRGRKETHWIWYVFPQVEGLGHSSMARHYAISSPAEARAYLEHPVLGPRLAECCEALLQHSDQEIERIMGFPDDLKLKSSMTLFKEVAPDPEIFQQVLKAFFGGTADQATKDFLALRDC